MNPHMPLTCGCWTGFRIMLFAYVLVHIELLQPQVYVCLQMNVLSAFVVIVVDVIVADVTCLIGCQEFSPR